MSVPDEKDGIILLAEDDPGNALLLSLAFRRSGVPAGVHVCPDGLAAVHYLEGEGMYQDRRQFPVPRLAVLEGHLPHLSGFEVLDRVRRRPQLRQLPVIVLVPSVFSDDVTRAYALGANSFLTKPVDSKEFIADLMGMIDFWLRPPPVTHD